MDILYLLIPMSVLLVFALMGVFAWALKSRQFDDLDREGERILDLPAPSGMVRDETMATTRGKTAEMHAMQPPRNDAAPS
jgi:cbb3-type cytochrome oxidase maturation protein